jgi:glycosyltransferase involved in cell wall biosynthesis
MRWLSRKTSAPIVWDVHEFYYASIAFNNSLRFRLLSALAAKCFSYLELRSCRDSFRGIVTVSSEMASRYSSRPIPCCVVGNYPSLDLFPPLNVTKRSRTPLLASIGAQFGPKGAYDIADAFVKLRNWIDCDLAFWGTFHPPHLATQLRERTAPNDHRHRTAIIEGPIDWMTLINERLPRAWLGFVLFDPTNPNYRFGLPNRFFEYWAAGVPVIATKGTEVGRIVEQMGGGVTVPNHHPETLAGHAYDLLSNPEKLREMGRRAREAVELHFNWDLAFGNLLDLYQQLGVNPLPSQFAITC